MLNIVPMATVILCNGDGKQINKNEAMLSYQNLVACFIKLSSVISFKNYILQFKKVNFVSFVCLMIASVEVLILELPALMFSNISYTSSYRP